MRGKIICQSGKTWSHYFIEHRLDVVLNKNRKYLIFDKLKKKYMAIEENFYYNPIFLAILLNNIVEKLM